MSDTPRTDKAVYMIDESEIETSELCFQRLADFARQLERELGEANRLNTSLLHLMEKLTANRDAWRKVAEKAIKRAWHQNACSFHREGTLWHNSCDCGYAEALQHFTQLQKEKE